MTLTTLTHEPLPLTFPAPSLRLLHGLRGVALVAMVDTLLVSGRVAVVEVLLMAGSTVWVGDGLSIGSDGGRCAVITLLLGLLVLVLLILLVSVVTEHVGGGLS